tara:strand:- start:9 stop:314 length:306 start_codon:yes stop_codon:yes gene_type:complete
MDDHKDLVKLAYCQEIEKLINKKDKEYQELSERCNLLEEKNKKYFNIIEKKDKIYHKHIKIKDDEINDRKKLYNDLKQSYKDYTEFKSITIKKLESGNMID